MLPPCPDPHPVARSCPAVHELVRARRLGKEAERRRWTRAGAWLLGVGLGSIAHASWAAAPVDASPDDAEVVDEDTEFEIDLTDGPEAEVEAESNASAAPAPAPADPVASPPAADLTTDTVSIIGDPADLPRVVGSAHVVDEATLERQENDDVERILRAVPGVYVRGEDGFGLRPNIGLRGADPDRSAKVTLMEDGVLFGPAPYAAPAAYFFPIVTRMVGIEVFKGPAATRYGPNTIGGAINLQTRPIPAEMKGGLDLAYGMYGYGKAHGHWGDSWRHGGLLVEAVRLQSNGFKQLDGGGDTGFGKNEVMLKGRVHGSPAARVYQQFDVKGGLSTETSHETYLGLSDDDFDATPYRRYAATQKGLMKWWRTQAEATYYLSVGEVLEFQATAYRHDFSRVWTKFDSFAGDVDVGELLRDPDPDENALDYLAILRGERDSMTPDQVLRIGTNDRRYVSQGVATTTRIHQSMKWVDQDVEIGARFHYDRVRRDHTADGYAMLRGTLVSTDQDTVTTLHNAGEAITGAFHVHDTMRIVDRVTIAPGARLEIIHTRAEDFLEDEQSRATAYVFLPGIGTYVDATRWLGVLAGIHWGFSPAAPGQDVPPERSINYEAGVRAHHGGFRAEALGYYNDYSNLTGECTFSSGCSSENIGTQFAARRARVAGLELSAGYRNTLGKRGWLDGNAEYTFTWTEFRENFESDSPQWGIVNKGDEIPYVPAHVVAAELAGGMRRWAVNGSLVYTSRMRDVPGKGTPPPDERVDGNLVLDLGARVWATRTFSIYGLLKNATAARYAVSRRPYGLRPGLPISFIAGIKLEFG